MPNIQSDPTALNAGWKEWYHVTESSLPGHELFRAAAPSYVSRDKDQKLTLDALDFLISKRIDSIISFNKERYTQEEEARLEKANIQYLHLRLGEYQPPTFDQLKQANKFFLNHNKTLVHCGSGHGRTGTGITALQLYTVEGKTLLPLASSWVTGLRQGGNSVEKRGQVSILAKRRNLLLPRIKETPRSNATNPFAIINFATGYYLTIHDGGVIARPPDVVETAFPVDFKYRWVISRDDHGDYTITNVTASGFVLTDSKDAKVNDRVKYGGATNELNPFFALKQVADGEEGRYIISPRPNPNFAFAIKAPDSSLDYDDSEEEHARLEFKDENNEFGLWILVHAT